MTDNIFEANVVRWRRQWTRLQRELSTLDEYVKQCRLFNAWCEQTGGSSNALNSADEYVAEIEARSAHAARWATRGLRAYGKFLVSDEQWPRTPGVTEKRDCGPFHRLQLPIEPPVQNAPTASTFDVQRLLATCKPAPTHDGVGASWTHLRDRALLLVLAHGGLRRAEVTAMTIDDLDLVKETIYVPKSKTNTTRTVALHPDATGALLRYLTACKIDRPTNERAVWLSCAHRPMKPLTPSGLSQMLDRRGALANVSVQSHAFRRRRTGEWMKAGGSETGLMAQMGWKTTAMIQRYSKDTLEQNSIAESRRLFAD